MKGWDQNARNPTPASTVSSSSSKKRNTGTKVEQAVGDVHVWEWMCPGCVQDLSEALTGRSISIWWKEDAVFYPGQVGDLDESSMCHRVVYDDGEWEFVHLPSSIVLYLKGENADAEDPKSKKNLTSKDVTKKRGVGGVEETSRSSAKRPSLTAQEQEYLNGSEKKISKRRKVEDEEEVVAVESPPPMATRSKSPTLEAPKKKRRR